MSTTTTNLGLTKPAVNDPVDEDIWGDQLNTDLDLIDSEFATATINKNYADKVVSRALLKDCGEVKQDVTASATTTIDYTAGQIVALSHGTNITTFSVTNWPPTGNLGWIRIFRIKDNSGTARTIAWPTITWTGGDTEPTLTSTANAVDHILLETYDGGTTIYGHFISA
jgi:hypothetical protein